MSFYEGIKCLLKNTLNSMQRMKMNSKADVEIGAHTKVRNATVASNVRVGAYCNIQGGVIEEYSYMGDYCELPQTRIGKFTSIAGHVKLAAGNHPVDYVSTSPYTYSPIKNSFAKEQLFDNEFYYIDDSKDYLCDVGNDVWIGTGAILVCGKRALHIGNGAVIAAGAVVTRNVPPYSVVAGCPAEVLKYRFSDQVRERLKQEEWWNKDRQWIFDHVVEFKNPEKAVRLMLKEDEK